MDAIGTEHDDPLLTQLANSLIDSCSKLQDVLQANKRLRESLDEARRVAHGAVAEKEQLEKEGLELRGRLDAYDVLLVEQIAARTAKTIISHAAAGTSSPRVVAGTATSTTAGGSSPLAVRRTKHHQRNYPPVAPRAPNSGNGRPASASGIGSAVPPPPSVSAGVPSFFRLSAASPYS